MCPAHPRTSDAALVAAARRLLARDGPAGVTMNAVGAEVGIRGPSLYKRFADRDALLRAVEGEALADLTMDLKAVAHGPPRDMLTRMAVVYRDFAHAAPPVYALLFAPVVWDEARVASRAAAAAPLLAVTSRLVGPDSALPAARLLTAFLHGWVSMELAGAFRLGGDVEAAFAYALSAVLDGLGAPPPG